MSTKEMAYNLIDNMTEEQIKGFIMMFGGLLNSQPNKKADSDAEWETFLRGLNGFSDDFFADGREMEIPTMREEL